MPALCRCSCCSREPDGDLGTGALCHSRVLPLFPIGWQSMHFLPRTLVPTPQLLLILQCLRENHLGNIR